MSSNSSTSRLTEYLDELLASEGLEFTKKAFIDIVVQATKDKDVELQEASLLILTSLREIDELKD